MANLILLDIAVEGGGAEEGDVDTSLTGDLILIRVVVRWVWFEHNMASSNKIELGVPGNLKAASALGPESAGVADGETKCGGQRLEQLGSGVSQVDGLQELWVDVAGQDQFMDLDFDSLSHQENGHSIYYLLNCFFALEIF
jgi:hypothetical protein